MIFQYETECKCWSVVDVSASWATVILKCRSSGHLLRDWHCLRRSIWRSQSKGQIMYHCQLIGMSLRWGRVLHLRWIIWGHCCKERRRTQTVRIWWRLWKNLMTCPRDMLRSWSTLWLVCIDCVLRSEVPLFCKHHCDFIDFFIKMILYVFAKMLSDCLVVTMIRNIVNCSDSSCLTMRVTGRPMQLLVKVLSLSAVQ